MRFSSLHDSMCLAEAHGLKCLSCSFNTGVTAVNGSTQCFPFSIANIFRNSTKISKIWMKSHYVTNLHDREKRSDAAFT